MELSFCIVNTNGREHLPACLRSVAATRPEGVEAEVLLLDNASTDGSVALAEAIAAKDGWLESALRVIPLALRQGKAANDTLLLREARGELCLLLNEDAELLAGAPAALLEALRADPRAGAAGAQLLDPAGVPQPCAWRLPGVGTALAQALFLHKRHVTQSGGEEARRVGWAQSSALLVRRPAVAEVGYLDPAFFVYSDETDLCKRLADAGWHTLHVPSARAIHHEQLSRDRGVGTRRVVEFHRNRDLYMRKHHGPLQAALVRLLTAASYLPRALAATVVAGHDPRWYLLHASKALRPTGEGLRELAERASTGAAAQGSV